MGNSFYFYDVFDVVFYLRVCFSGFICSYVCDFVICLFDSYWLYISVSFYSFSYFFYSISFFSGFFYYFGFFLSSIGSCSLFFFASYSCFTISTKDFASNPFTPFFFGCGGRFWVFPCVYGFFIVFIFSIASFLFLINESLSFL